MQTLVKTAPSARLANFRYAAPEQRTPGEIADHKTDIYALGMILNELFTGVVPHGTDYKRIGESAPEYGYLDRIVDACLRQERSNRPDSIEAIKRDVHIYGQEAVTLQKLSAIENRVVDESVIDDPLAAHPIGLVGADWDANILTLELSQPVTEKWVSALINMGSYEASGERALISSGSEATRQSSPQIRMRFSRSSITSKSGCRALRHDIGACYERKRQRGNARSRNEFASNACSRSNG